MSSVSVDRFGICSAAWAAAVGLVLSAGSAFGGFVGSVVSYTPGTGVPAGFTDPSSALGGPAPVVGAGSTFPNVLDPFSPAFGTSEVVVVGTGGQLTLQLAKPVNVGAGPQLGVISNVGLIDINYPSGTTGAPAGTFGGGTAEVRVSEDGKNFVSLGDVTFDLPASYFSKLSGPYETAVGSGDVAADPSKPFTGTLADFSGKDFTQVLQTLNGSVGGTWLSLAGTGLTSVDYVQFLNPTGTTGRLAIDAVTTADAGGPPPPPPPTAVPLPAGAPAGLAMLAGIGLVAASRRRVGRA